MNRLVVSKRPSRDNISNDEPNIAATTINTKAPAPDE
jgi:hypothetical protein